MSSLAAWVAYLNSPWWICPTVISYNRTFYIYISIRHINVEWCIGKLKRRVKSPIQTLHFINRPPCRWGRACCGESASRVCCDSSDNTVRPDTVRDKAVYLINLSLSQSDGSNWATRHTGPAQHFCLNIHICTSLFCAMSAKNDSLQQRHIFPNQFIPIKTHKHILSCSTCR